MTIRYIFALFFGLLVSASRNRSGTLQICFCHAWGAGKSLLECRDQGDGRCGQAI